MFGLNEISININVSLVSPPEIIHSAAGVRPVPLLTRAQGRRCRDDLGTLDSEVGVHQRAVHATDDGVCCFERGSGNKR